MAKLTKEAKMAPVNVLQAKTNLSKLLEVVETGREREVVIARNGKPVAKLVPISAPAAKPQRIGIAKGLFEWNGGPNDGDEEVLEMFGL